jgi:hypothetical protein
MRPTRDFGRKTTPDGKPIKECAYTYLLKHYEKEHFKHFEVEEEGEKWVVTLHHEGDHELPGTRLEHGVIVYRVGRVAGKSKGNWEFVVLCKDRSNEAKELYGFRGRYSPSVFNYKWRHESNPYGGVFCEAFVEILNERLSNFKGLVFEQPIDELLERNGG